MKKIRGLPTVLVVIFLNINVEIQSSLKLPKQSLYTPQLGAKKIPQVSKVRLSPQFIKSTYSIRRPERGYSVLATEKEKSFISPTSANTSKQYTKIIPPCSPPTKYITIFGEKFDQSLAKATHWISQITGYKQYKDQINTQQKNEIEKQQKDQEKFNRFMNFLAGKQIDVETINEPIAIPNDNYVLALFNEIQYARDNETFYRALSQAIAKNPNIDQKGFVKINITPLKVATILNDAPLVKDLLAMGADPNFSPNDTERVNLSLQSPPLWLALQRGNNEIFNMLVKNKRTDISSPNKYERNLTPSQYVSQIINEMRTSRAASEGLYRELDKVGRIAVVLNTELERRSPAQTIMEGMKSLD